MNAKATVDKELRELKAAKEKALRELNDKAEAENRGLTKEEKSQWDQLAQEHTDTEEPSLTGFRT